MGCKSVERCGVGDGDGTTKKIITSMSIFWFIKKVLLFFFCLVYWIVLFILFLVFMFLSNLCNGTILFNFFFHHFRFLNGIHTHTWTLLVIRFVWLFFHHHYRWHHYNFCMNEFRIPNVLSFILLFLSFIIVFCFNLKIINYSRTTTTEILTQINQ